MVAGFFTQFLLLTWKNILLQRRKICVTVFEIVLPLAFPILLIIIRNLVDLKPTLKAANLYDKEDFSYSYFSFDSDILYSPNTTLIQEIMNNTSLLIADQLGSYRRPSFKGFQTEEDILNHLRHSSNGDYWRDLSAVVFDSSQDYSRVLPNDISYKIRMNREWETELTYKKKVYDMGPYYNYQYGNRGFLDLMYGIDAAIIKHHNPSADLMNHKKMRMPYPPYYTYPFGPFIRYTVALTLVLGLILPVLQLTKEIVYDREKKLKETLKMMGMSSFVYWFSWFFKGFIYLIITLSITVIIFQAGPTKIFDSSDSTLIFFFFLSYAVSVVAFSFLLSSFFNKANTASYFCAFVFFITFIPHFGLDSQYAEMTRPQKMALCLLNNMALAVGVTTVVEYESTGVGVQWDAFTKPPTIDGDFTFGDAILMLWIDSAIYFLITWYIDGVRPGEYGVPQPFYFPFTKTYWCGGRQTKTSIAEDVNHDPKYFEDEPKGLSVGISMNHLRKVYKSGMKEIVAVEGTSLNIYQGQITALLGHNGAGKTTTMSMLTGFIPSTSGSARVNGYDVDNDINSVRGSLGMCPQHNTLFDNLTVKEQLEFYFKLKACNRNTIDQDITETLRAFKLTEKKNDLAGTLSGGQKRKLSVAIALIGGSKVIILDEPTSGMDPGARRQMWDILQKYKEGRTIVLSTHYMDEADVLGDRIAIMADGVVKCCGTSLFLKKLYGAGYHLILVKEPNCNVLSLMEVIKSHIPSASLEMQVGAELTVLLPTEESSQFQPLFTDLEEKGSKLGIKSFGISATTMEEVFLSVKDDDQNVNKGYLEDGTDAHQVQFEIQDQASFMPSMADAHVDIDFNAGLSKNTGMSVVFQQYYGLLNKRALHMWRSRFMILIQLVIPVLLAIFGLLADQSISKTTEHAEPSLSLNLNPFPNSITTITNGENPTATSRNLTQAYSQWFKNRRLDVTEYDPSADFDINKFWLNKIREIGLRTFTSRYVIGFGVEGTQIISYYNGEDIHSPAISLANTMNFLLKFYCGESKNIRTVNEPLPEFEELRYGSRSTGVVLFKGLSLSQCILFGMACLVASFSVFHIREKSSGAKHLQKVSGVSSRVFWLANLTWDLFHFLIPIFIILICFAGFQVPAYTEDGRLGLVFFCFLMFGLASIASMYLLHFLFKSPAGGTVAMIIINTVAGVFTLVTVTILFPLKETKSAAETMDNVFMVFFPHYCLGKSFINIYVRYSNRDRCMSSKPADIIQMLSSSDSNILCPDNNYLEWDYPGCGKYLCMMSVQFVVYMLLVLLIDSGILQRYLYRTLCSDDSVSDPSQSIIQDSDVIDEANRVNSAQLTDLMTTDKLIIKNMKKTYGLMSKFQAVKDISIGISEQECFGLLGQNGAGKTTTFKMLTGDVMVSSGKAYVSGFSVKGQLRKVHQCLGYCPQFDALIDTLTGREILTLYARLRGVREGEIRRVVNEIMEAVTITEYANKLCGTYSGGNKRKLSTAIAIIGDPQFLMLDEPTTGVDPAARRQIWNLLSKIRESGRTLVLTSHSMEECDALCTKIVIMVNGKFVCFGSPQHLKNKFAQGYTLTVRLSRDDNGNVVDSGTLCRFLMNEFPGTGVFDDHQGYLDFQVPHPNLSLSKLFKEMERAKSEYGVEDYSVHQTSLEQVFLAFTRKQVPPVEKKGACPCCRSKRAYEGQIIMAPPPTQIMGAQQV